MKKKEIKRMNKKELEEKLRELRLEIAKEKGQISVGGVPESQKTGKLRNMRKNIARIITELSSKK